MNFDEDGEGTVSLSRVYKGLFFEEIERVLRQDETDKKRDLVKSLNIPDFSLLDYSHSGDSKKEPVIYEKMNIRFFNYCQVMGNYLFFIPNLLNKITDVPVAADQRTTDIFIRRSSCETDTVIYTIPGKYSVGSIPVKTEIKTKFGNYSSEIINDKGTLYYIRNFELRKGLFPKEDYPAFKEFFDEILKADANKVSLKKI